LKKKYATRDEDLFTDMTDIFASVSNTAAASAQLAASTTVKGSPDRSHDDSDDEGDYSCF